MGYKSTKGVKRSGPGTKAAVKFIFSLVLFFITGPPGHAKAILYDGRDGLSSNDISIVAKDNRGLMWIGTYNGLNIYDGYTFTKTQGILSNLHIASLALNKSQNEMLVGTHLGLFTLDLSTLKATRIYAEHKRDELWCNKWANTICVDPNTATVYVSFGNGYLARINAHHKLELICRLPDTSRSIRQIVLRDKDLLVNNGDLYSIDPHRNKATILPNINHLAPLNSISRSDGNSLLLNSYNSKLSLLDLQTLTDTMPAALKKIVAGLPYRIIQSTLKNNQLYMLCDNYTVCIADLTRGTVKEISKKYPDIFEGKTYCSLFVDEHNIIWIATNKGLIKVEDRPELFIRELYNFPARVSTRKMIEDADGDIYVASYIGLWHCPKQTQSWVRYTEAPEDAKRTYPRIYPGPVQPLALFEEPETGYIYIGFDSDLLLRFNKKRKVFENIGYTTDLKGTSLRGIYSIIQDRKDILWLGCGSGLASYDPASNKLVLHRNDAFDIGSLRVRYIATDTDKEMLYVATTSGLYLISTTKGLIRQLNTTTKPALTNNDILFAAPDEQGYIWLGTNGGGINIIAPDLKKIQYLRKQNGLSNEIVYGILPQDENTLWISTFNGLDRYRKDRQSFSNFFEEDGLSSNEFNQNSFLKTNEGKMYFGSINGITSFYPQQFSTPEPFNIFISGISQWNDKTQTLQLLRNKIENSSTIIKKPSDLLLELHFGCTDYTDPLRNSYSYRIKELSENWIALEDRHTLNLGGIPYGNYTIEVKAINSRGVSSANILIFHVKVIQPFYRTWWFFALILFGLAIIFYSAYQIKYQGFKNILHLRMKIASNLHDEVGSLLTRITMFSDNLRYSKNSEEQRNAKLEKIAVLSRNAIASMSDVLWAIDSRNDFAGNLLDRMREHAEEMLFPLGIDVNFVLSGTDLKQPITSDTRGEVYLIFKEAINNIAKHSGATKVDITYQINDKNFLLRITNNTTVGTINEQSTGQGLNNMKMRAAKIGAHIEVQNKEQLFSVEIRN